jgi:putative Ca2+/H+ antiporter (TMEM165/GDT1 family)
LEAFLVSTGIVALGEMGDKTQLLALMLAARFRKPWPIVAGILVATLANHALAGAVGAWVARAARPRTSCAGSSAARSWRWRRGC